ncbi:hypothetical protein [Vagococcus hydrophili]|uniref:IrrE N-terminal-like domain-containing protein n=1 Tax=Vagococcus hydrophili TaxID=2714947 RepID=A0A6G8AQ16_9ENTE|nr:hypothetical protein [Vagococcus hydrophili]QIL47070.1 hypothetical protein G7082_00270 [Vagococcus hydrophili]
MDKLIKWLKHEGIEVYFVDMEEVGLCLVNSNTILISNLYNELTQLKAIRHELKHFDHKDYIYLYDQFVYHSKMEYEAEQNVVKESLNEYIAFLDGDIEKVNYLKFLEDYELDSNYAPYVIQLLTKMKLRIPKNNLENSENCIAIHGFVK